MAATAQQLAGLRALVRRTLLSPACQKISFDFAYSHGYGYNRNRIDGWALSHIAMALDVRPADGRGIRIGVARITKPGQDASYSSVNNALHFPSAAYGATMEERALIVHECVHAYRDALGMKSRINGAAANALGRTRGVQEEAEAYIAQMLYSLYESTPTGGTPDRAALAGSDSLFDAAFDIAVKVWQTPGALVGVGDHAELRKAILADKGYDFMHGNQNYVYDQPNNGIRL